MAVDTAYRNAFRDRMRKLHQEAHPELWPEPTPTPDPIACLLTHPSIRTTVSTPTTTRSNP